MAPGSEARARLISSRTARFGCWTGKAIRWAIALADRKRHAEHHRRLEPRSEILKVDEDGRVRTPPEKREAMLAEYDRSGMTGAQFCAFAGCRIRAEILATEAAQESGAQPCDSQRYPLYHYRKLPLPRHRSTRLPARRAHQASLNDQLASQGYHSQGLGENFTLLCNGNRCIARIITVIVSRLFKKPEHSLRPICAFLGGIRFSGSRRRKNIAYFDRLNFRWGTKGPIIGWDWFYKGGGKDSGQKSLYRELIFIIRRKCNIDRSSP